MGRKFGLGLVMLFCWFYLGLYIWVICGNRFIMILRLVFGNSIVLIFNYRDRGRDWVICKCYRIRNRM